MLFIESPGNDPRFNLALEQYVFDEMDPAQSYFMLWQNGPSIIIGKNQNAAAEIDANFVRGAGLPVVRRLSGGGAVYHDLGNVNFTFITDRDEDAGIDLRPFCAIVTAALASFGIQAEISGRNDITVEGRKVSGNAQYVRGGRVMHHGCILFDTDLSVLGRALRPNRAKIRSKGVDSVSSRVANLAEFLPAGTDVRTFMDRLLAFAAESAVRYELSEADLRRVEEIRAGRYDLWEWNYGRSPAYEFSETAYIPGCGTVTAQTCVAGGVLTDVSLSGDFFGVRDVEGLCSLLCGLRADRAFLGQRLASFSVGDYIGGITPAQLAALLVP